MVIADGYLARSVLFLFFVNGLAFFAMGLSIALQTRRTMAFRPSRDLWLLAAYGLIASVSNWLHLLQPVGTAGAVLLKGTLLDCLSPRRVPFAPVLDSGCSLPTLLRNVGDSLGARWPLCWPSSWCYQLPTVSKTG